MIPFSRRELMRAWRGAYSASLLVSGRSNAHRLLLFYAAECGLKAVWLKQQNLDVLTGNILGGDGKSVLHHLNRLLDLLKAGASCRLPTLLSLPPIRMAGNLAPQPRQCEIGELNQVWRYGGELLSPDDATVEVALEQVCRWIEGILK